MKDSKHNTAAIHILPLALITFGIFLLIWTGWVALRRNLGIGDIINGFISFGDLVWLLFASVLMFFYRQRLSIKPGELFATPPRIKVLIPLLACIAIYYIISMLISTGGIYVNPETDILQTAVMFLIVAIQEELLFRGWFLNILAAVLTERKANLISAMMFLFVHVPGWIMKGLPVPLIGYNSVGIFALGLLFGWSFRKSRSIWVPVILHMVWDVMSRIAF